MQSSIDADWEARPAFPVHGTMGMELEPGWQVSLDLEEASDPTQAKHGTVTLIEKKNIDIKL